MFISRTGSFLHCSEACIQRVHNNRVGFIAAPASLAHNYTYKEVNVSQFMILHRQTTTSFLRPKSPKNHKTFLLVFECFGVISHQILLDLERSRNSAVSHDELKRPNKLVVSNVSLKLVCSEPSLRCVGGDLDPSSVTAQAVNSSD